LRVLHTMLGGYRGFVFIRTGHPRQKERLRNAHELASLVRLPLEVVEARRERLERLVHGPWDGREFLQIPVGERITAAAFLPGPASVDTPFCA